jgi:hypothetical protein
MLRGRRCAGDVGRVTGGWGGFRGLSSMLGIAGSVARYRRAARVRIETMVVEYVELEDAVDRISAVRPGGEMIEDTDHAMR